MCRSNPQEYTSPAAPITYSQPADTWYCCECGTLNLDWVDVCPACGRGVRPDPRTQSHAADYHAAGYYTADYATQAPAGSPAPGSWICENCGAANSDLTADFCPICGIQR